MSLDLWRHDFFVVGLIGVSICLVGTSVAGKVLAGPGGAKS